MGEPLNLKGMDPLFHFIMVINGHPLRNSYPQLNMVVRYLLLTYLPYFELLLVHHGTWNLSGLAGDLTYFLFVRACNNIIIINMSCCSR